MVQGQTGIVANMVTFSSAEIDLTVTRTVPTSTVARKIFFWGVFYGKFKYGRRISFLFSLSQMRYQRHELVGVLAPQIPPLLTAVVTTHR